MIARYGGSRWDNVAILYVSLSIRVCHLRHAKTILTFAHIVDICGSLVKEAPTAYGTPAIAFMDESAHQPVKICQ